MNKKPRKFNEAKVLELREKGVSIPDIAKQEGVAPSTIYRFLEAETEDYQKLERFKSNKLRILQQLQSRKADVQLKILERLPDEEIDKFTNSEKKEFLRVLCTSQAIDHDKERQLTEGRDITKISDKELEKRLLRALFSRPHLVAEVFKAFGAEIPAQIQV
jgi:lambda repressor-like predicted transcriptional regulator